MLKSNKNNKQKVGVEVVLNNQREREIPKRNS